MKYILNKLIVFFLIVFFFSISVLGNLDKILLGQVFITKLSFFILVFLLLLSIAQGKVSVKHVSVFLFFFVGILFIFIIAVHRDIEFSNTLKEIFPYAVPMVSLFIINGFDSRWFELVQTKIMKVILFFAIIHIVVSVVSNFNITIYSLAYSFYNDWSNEGFIGDHENSFVTLRVQFGYSMVLIFGVLLSIDNAQDNKTWPAKLYVLIFLISILSTQSRAFIIGVALSPFLYFFIKKLISNFNNHSCRIIGVLLSLLLPSLIIFLVITAGSLDGLGLSRPVGENERVIQLESFLVGLDTHPLLGIGLGGNFDIIRSEATPWIYELNILSVIFKIGVVGLFLLISFLILFLNSIVNFGKVFNVNKYSLYLTFLFVIVFVSNSNPYLANFCGTGVLMYIFTKIGFLEREVKREVNWG